MLEESLCSPPGQLGAREVRCAAQYPSGTAPAQKAVRLWFSQGEFCVPGRPLLKEGSTEICQGRQLSNADNKSGPQTKDLKKEDDNTLEG